MNGGMAKRLRGGKSEGGKEDRMAKRQRGGRGFLEKWVSWLVG